MEEWATMRELYHRPTGINGLCLVFCENGCKARKQHEIEAGLAAEGPALTGEIRGEES